MRRPLRTASAKAMMVSEDCTLIFTLTNRAGFVR